jgi:predicted nucleic acid-binding protein
VPEAARRRERAEEMRRAVLRMDLGQPDGVDVAAELARDRAGERALLIYLDSAVVVKLAHAEPESAALRGWLGERAETGWISSVLTEIESFRALARYAPDAASRLPAVLVQVDLDQHIRMLARTVTPATVRSLDAIHLGTALHSRPSLTSFVTYDKRLLNAAHVAGLPIESPA